MKIALDYGHGVGQDRGASGFIAEETIIAIVGDLAVTKLRALGHQVVLVRPVSASSVGNSLAQRCANAAGCDIYISIHANAGGGTGAEVYTYQGQKLPEGQRYLQYLINGGFHVHSGDRLNVNSGIKDGSDLYVIGNTSMKALLFENCFVDTKVDVDFFNAHKELFANALVYGITGVDVAKVPTPTPAPAPVNPLNNFNINMYAHIENIGDTRVAGINDVTIGTTGKNLRMEAISINIDNGVDITYDVHVQDIGNIDGQAEGQIEGTSGRSLRLEAITITASKVPVGYKLQYQAHVENIGWMPWVESGQLAGTTGKSLRMEALRVRIVAA